MPTYAFPKVTDMVIEVVVNGVLAAAGSNAKNSLNVFNYRLTTAAGPLVKADVAAAFRTAVLVPLLAASNARYSPTSVSIRKVSDPSDSPATIAQAGAGAIVTDALPSDTAVFVYMKSGNRGRSYNGSKHFGGGSEADTTGDVITGGAVARWQAVRDACKLALTDAGGNVWTPFILSRTFSKLTLPASIFGVNVTDALLDLNIGTMRKRRSRTVR